MKKHEPIIVGKIINAWEVLELSHINNNYVKFWKCKCNCGTIKTIRDSDLKSDKSSKCRKCKGKETSERLLKDISDQKIGKWTILERIGVAKNSRTPLWRCRCSCGFITNVRASNLHSKSTKKCIKCCFISDEDMKKNYFRRISVGAKKRNIPFKISIKETFELFEKQNHLCSILRIPLFFERNNITASLDRIDSSRGYMEDNIQWVHKVINVMKNKLSNMELINISKYIYEINKDMVDQDFDINIINSIKPYLKVKTL